MDNEDTVYITMEYYSSIENNEILLFATTKIDLEGTILNEISQTGKDKYCMTSIACGIKKNIKRRSDLWFQRQRLGIIVLE